VSKYKNNKIKSFEPPRNLKKKKLTLLYCAIAATDISFAINGNNYSEGLRVT
jgi:hypothetical protein